MGFGLKPDFEALLPPGRHVMTFQDFQARFVGPFPNNHVRKKLFLSLEMLVQEVLVAGICCELWLDGSFLTTKEEPDDIDAALIVDADADGMLTEAQRSILDRIDLEAAFEGVDSFVFVRKSREDSGFGEESDPASTWHEVYGLEHNKRWLKGYAVIRLGETHVGLRICS